MNDFNYKGHIAAGIALGAAYSAWLHPEHFRVFEQYQFWAGTLLGALIPDLDHQDSILNQRILLINRKWFQKLVYMSIGLAAMAYYGFSFNSVVFAALLTITAFSSHREFTHRLTGLVLITASIFICLGVTGLSIGLFLGIVSHIAADKIHDVVT